MDGKITTRWRNSNTDYGVVAIVLHWLVAVMVIGLFVLGLWMTGLDYYDSWYRRAPDLHKSIGLTLLLFMLVRLLWRITSITPADEPGSSVQERRLAHTVHRLLYLLLFAQMASGYLISTADGRAIDVFGLFDVPAIVTGIPRQEDVAGYIHWTLAVVLMTTVGLHALAALKHHFVNKDRTLKKMLGIF